jgi:hypothetical protein
MALLDSKQLNPRFTGSFTISGSFSGDSQSSGSFGRLDTTGHISASGRIFEQGTSVIDHATAMAIVFGG